MRFHLPEVLDNAYIWNRPVSASVTDQNNNTTTLATNTYDSGTLASINGTLYEFDANAAPGNIRGNVTQTQRPAGRLNIRRRARRKTHNYLEIDPF